MGMKGYKAFGEGMVCKGKQYAENTIFEEEKANPCVCGMHFCKEPLAVLRYYPAAQAKEFAEVEALDEALTDDNTKFCTTKLKVGAKLSIRQLVDAQIDFVREHCTNENNAETGKSATAVDHGAATAGDYGAATAGDHGAATAGDHGAATAGDYGAATAGDYGAATAGYAGAATSRGKVLVGENGAGLVRCETPRAKGGKGAVLFIVKEKENSYDISDFCMVVVGKDGIKPDTLYTVENGKAVEVDAN